jgi:hypothetical protein
MATPTGLVPTGIGDPGGASVRPGRRLDVDNPAAGALLTVLLPNTATVEGMPTIMDLDFLPDMGRMNG